jgi:hypothetical protein
MRGPVGGLTGGSPRGGVAQQGPDVRIVNA